MGIQKWRGKHTHIYIIYIYIHTHIHMYIYIYIHILFIHPRFDTKNNIRFLFWFDFLFVSCLAPTRQPRFFSTGSIGTLGFPGSHGPRCYGAICQGGFCTCGSRGIGKLFRVGFRWEKTWAERTSEKKRDVEMEQIEEIGQKPTVQSIYIYM